MAILNKAPVPLPCGGSCSRSGNGDGLAWFSKPYPHLPYRYVQAMYPRDTMVQQWSRQPAYDAAYEHPVRDIASGSYVDPRSWRHPMP